MSTYGNISRRAWLKGLALVSAAAGISATTLESTAAEAKASKSAVHYQDYPNGMRMCHMCKFFTSPGGGRYGMGCGMMGRSMMGAGVCEVVEGSISPMGYCDLYVPRNA